MNLNGIKIIQNELSYQNYRDLLKANKWKPVNELNFPNLISNSLYVLTAFYNEQCIGMIRVIGDTKTNILKDIVVHPEFHRNGIGSMLYKHVKSYLIHSYSKDDTSYLYVHFKSQLTSFYQKVDSSLVFTSKDSDFQFAYTILR